MNKAAKHLLVSAAIAGIIGVAAAGSAPASAEGGEVKCDGGNACKGMSSCKGPIECSNMNPCKGMSGCKSKTNECKGKNACKGKGFIMAKDDATCTQAKKNLGSRQARRPGNSAKIKRGAT